MLLAYEKAATFFSKSGKIRAQIDYSVHRVYDVPPVLTALFELFGKDGGVFSETERGRTTIEVFALNRRSLVLAREKAMRRTKEIEIDSMLPYAAVRRQAALDSISRSRQRFAAKQIHTEFENYESGLEAFGLESAAAPRQEYFIKSRMIERIELENFRLFRKLALALSSSSEAAPWLMLLGENGLGRARSSKQSPWR